MQNSKLRMPVSLALAAILALGAFTQAEVGSAPPKPVETMMKDAKIETLTRILASQTGAPIYLRGKYSGIRVSLEVAGITLEEALAKLTESKPLAWWRDASGAYIVAGTDYANDFGPDSPLAREHPKLLPPVPSLQGPMVSIQANQMKIEDLIAKLNPQLPKPITLKGQAAGRLVTAVVMNQPLEVGLETLAGPGMVWWRAEDGGYNLAETEYYRVTVAGLPPGPKLPPRPETVTVPGSNR